MPNLAETVNDFLSVQTKASVTKDRTSLGIEDSLRGSKDFSLVTVDAIKVPMLAVGDDDGPLIIDVNASGIRKTKAGFVPKVIVLSGANKLRAARESKDNCSAWVGSRIMASRELKQMIATNVAVTMLQEQLLDTPNVAAPALGGFNGPSIGGYDVTNFGARSSEANVPAYKLMLNVEEALAMYETEKAEGVHKVIYTPFAPIPAGLINASREAKIAAEVNNIDNFSVMDFLSWQNKKCSMKAAEQRKEGRPSSDFVYIGDNHDISTWHLPKYSIEAACESLSTIVSPVIPREERSLVTELLMHEIEIMAGGEGSGRHKEIADAVKDGFDKLPKFIQKQLLQRFSKAISMASEAGPHLGLGKTAQKHIDKINSRDVGTKERSSLAKKGKALPDGSFPIANKSDLANAKQAVGRAKNPAKARRFINKRAKQLGAKPLSAGGPGSGRKPGWSEGSRHAHLGLNNEHNKITNMGLKYVGSARGRYTNTIAHRYTDPTNPKNSTTLYEPLSKHGRAFSEQVIDD